MGAPVYTSEHLYNYEDTQSLFHSPDFIAEWVDKPVETELHQLRELARNTIAMSASFRAAFGRWKDHAIATGDMSNPPNPDQYLFNVTYRGARMAVQRTPFRKVGSLDKSGGYKAWKGWFSLMVNFYRQMVVPHTVSYYLAYSAFVFFVAPSPFSIAVYLAAGVALVGTLITIQRLMRGWNVPTDHVRPIPLETGFEKPVRSLWSRLLSYFVAAFTWGMHTASIAVALIYLLPVTGLLWGSEWIGFPVISQLMTVLLHAEKIPGGDLAVIFLLMLPFHMLFYLAIWMPFYVIEGLVLYPAGVWKGLRRFMHWDKPVLGRWIVGDSVISEMQRVEAQIRDIDRPIGGARMAKTAYEHFLDKIVPRQLNLTPQRAAIAWSKTWNMIVASLYEEHKLTEAEFYRLRYHLTGTSDQDFLAGSVLRHPNLSRKPLNEEADERIRFFLTSLYMDMPQAPIWDAMRSMTVLTPLYGEDVRYTFKQLYAQENTGYSILARLVDTFPDEWWNFIAFYKKQYGMTAAEEALLMTVKNNMPTERLAELGRLPRRLQQAVEDWGGLRGQEYWRTCRGQAYKWLARELLAKINFPTNESLESNLNLRAGGLADYMERKMGLPGGSLTAQKAYECAVQAKVNEKFQLLLAHQPYMDAGFQTGGDMYKREAIELLMRKYPFMQLAFLQKADVGDGMRWYTVLIQYKPDQRRQMTVPASLVAGVTPQGPDLSALSQGLVGSPVKG
ncbi:MAG: hypothetical protein WCG06_04625, partial [Candidatus Omnitrophota bacterium]